MEIRFITWCLDSNMCCYWSIFYELLSRARRRVLQGPISGFPFCRVLCFHHCELDGAVLLPLYERAAFVSGGGPHTQRVATTCSSRHRRRRRQATTGDDGGGDGDGGDGGGGGNGECGVSGDGQSVVAQRRQCAGAAAIAAVAAMAATNIGMAVAATVGGGLVGAACRCGLRWCGAHRTARWRCDLVAYSKFALADPRNSAKIASARYFFAFGGACGGQLGAAPSKKLR